MSIRFFNTLSRQVEEFRPIEPGRVRLYTCGPTVYNFAHIGNFRAYVFEDLLHRYLEFRGLDCVQVMNLTDVDDKTIKGAIAAGLPLKTYTQPYIDGFFSDLKTLNVTPADRYPAATDHVPEMIAIIETLIAKGHAYVSDDRSVYYRIDSFPHYGCLAHIDREGMKAGARVAQDEYEKDNVADFALWKAWDEKDGDIAWDSPWGRGRPGWHIECSAMSMKYLGESFDIHTGGVDNIFPHHDDEIAQSEAATGRKFVNYWLHCAHLVVEGKKMSKSLGNFFTLRDLIDKGWSGREIRYVLLATHYRQSLNFTFDSLAAARTALQRLDEFRARLVDAAAAGAGVAAPGQSEPPPAWAIAGRDAFTAALDDDLNISGGLAALFDLLRDGNRAIDRKEVTATSAAAVLSLWNELDRALGFLQPPAAEIPADVLALVEARQVARKNKDWKESDRIRDALAALGWEVKDTPQGPKTKRKG
jgi:cysteinyl-tRNA synthetase